MDLRFTTTITQNLNKLRHDKTTEYLNNTYLYTIGIYTKPKSSGASYDIITYYGVFLRKLVIFHFFFFFFMFKVSHNLNNNNRRCRRRAIMIAL